MHLFYLLLLVLTCLADQMYISCILAKFSSLHYLWYRNGLRCISLILYISSLQFKDRHSANDMMETYSPRHCFTMHMWNLSLKIEKKVLGVAMNMYGIVVGGIPTLSEQSWITWYFFYFMNTFDCIQTRK